MIHYEKLKNIRHNCLCPNLTTISKACNKAMYDTVRESELVASLLVFGIIQRHIILKSSLSFQREQNN